MISEHVFTMRSIFSIEKFMKSSDWRDETYQIGRDVQREIDVLEFAEYYIDLS